METGNSMTKTLPELKCTSFPNVDETSFPSSKRLGKPPIPEDQTHYRMGMDLPLLLVYHGNAFCCIHQTVYNILDQ